MSSKISGAVPWKKRKTLHPNASKSTVDDPSGARKTYIPKRAVATMKPLVNTSSLLSFSPE